MYFVCLLICLLLAPTLANEPRCVNQALEASLKVRRARGGETGSETPTPPKPKGPNPTSCGPHSASAWRSEPAALCHFQPWRPRANVHGEGLCQPKI